MKLWQIIRPLRRVNNLTTEEVAAWCNVTQNYVEKIETGNTERGPGNKFVESFADLVGIRPEAINALALVRGDFESLEVGHRTNFVMQLIESILKTSGYNDTQIIKFFGLHEELQVHGSRGGTTPQFGAG